MACLFRIDRLCDLNCHIDKLDSDSINVMKRFKFTPQWSVILESAKTIINFKIVHDEWNWFANYRDILGCAKQLCIRFVRHSLCLYVCLSQVFVTCPIIGSSWTLTWTFIWWHTYAKCMQFVWGRKVLVLLLWHVINLYWTLFVLNSFTLCHIKLFVYHV